MVSAKNNSDLLYNNTVWWKAFMKMLLSFSTVLGTNHEKNRLVDHGHNSDILG